MSQTAVSQSALPQPECAASQPAPPQAGAGAASASAAPVPPAHLPRTGPAPVLRGRIGTGFSPVPHRYRLYLSAGCPLSLSVSRALTLLGLEGSVATTLLGADSAAPSAGHAALRRAYEATGPHHAGPLVVPALCDTWSGRVVSNHTPDILDDLCRLSADPAFRAAS
ncbi:hypothetical protein [Streptomyces sp. NPDC060031]|uniref:hypothetical protein n=1 Tax=Streptomyces sp. NPDC060031 TaxID=3347043 RepID=UPI0036B552B4